MFSTAGEYKVKLEVKSGANPHTAEADVKVTTATEADKKRRIVTADDEWWQEKLLESRRNALASVRNVAEKWQALLGTVLALFGAVAFVTAPTALEELPAGRGAATVVLVVFAFGLALAALLYAAAAGHGTPRIVEGQDSRRFQLESHAEYNRAIGKLRNARILVLLAIGVIAIGTLVAWSATIFRSPGATPTLALVRADGAIYCGELTPAAPSDPLEIGGQPIPGPVEELTIVSSCPRAGSEGGWFETNKDAIRGAGVTIGLLLLAWLGWWYWRSRLSGMLARVVAVAISLVVIVLFVQSQAAVAWLAVGGVLAVVTGAAANAVLGRIVRAL